MTSPTPETPATTPKTEAGSGQWTKLLLEVGPLLVFFLGNTWYGLIPGTAAFVVATVASLAVSWLLLRRIPVMPLVGGVFVILFGGLTVLLKDDVFIKIKPTVVNVIFAGILLAGQLSGRNFLKLVFDGAFHLTETGWRILTWRWVGFFLVLAVLNLIVWQAFSSDTWVAFKVFGNLPLTIAFSLAQIPLLLRHQLNKEPEGDTAPARPR